MLEKIIRNIKIVGISGLIGLSVLGGCSRSDEGSLVVDVKGSSVKGSSIYLDGALVKQVSKDSFRDLELKLKPGSYEVKVENEDYPKNYGERVAIIRGEELKLSVDLGKTYKEIEHDKYGSPEKTVKIFLNNLKDYLNSGDISKELWGCFSENRRGWFMDKGGDPYLKEELKELIYVDNTFIGIPIFSSTLVRYKESKFKGDAREIELSLVYDGDFCAVPVLFKEYTNFKQNSNGDRKVVNYLSEWIFYFKLIDEDKFWKIEEWVFAEIN